MKKFFPLLLLMPLFWAASCDKDNENKGQLELNFKGVFGAEPLAMYASTYGYYDNTPVKFQLFQFYLSDIALIRSDNGEAVPVSDVELVSFKDIQTTAAAQQGVSLLQEGIPPGRYKAIRMGLGVSPALNATSPGSYTPPHPLDDHYWSWALGYVFMKIEGNADFDGDGQFSDKLTFHTGSDPLYRTLEFSKDMEVKEDQPLKLSFTADLKRVMGVSSSNYLDIRTHTQDHTNNPEVYNFLYDNLEMTIQLNP